MKDLMKYGILGVLVLFSTVLAGCTTQEFSVPTASMEPTIPARSTITVELRAYAEADPERFDIVVFQPPAPYDRPTQEGDPRVWVFRVVGLPGEEIEIDDDGVHIDSERLDLPQSLAYIPYGREIPVALDPDEFFLLGDNTAHALDSREVGPVPRKNIIGKVTGIQQTGRGNE